MRIELLEQRDSFVKKAEQVLVAEVAARLPVTSNALSLSDSTSRNAVVFYCLLTAVNLPLVICTFMMALGAVDGGGTCLTPSPHQTHR